LQPDQIPLCILDGSLCEGVLLHKYCRRKKEIKNIFS